MFKGPQNRAGKQTVLDTKTEVISFTYGKRSSIFIMYLESPRTLIGYFSSHTLQHETHIQRAAALEYTKAVRSEAIHRDLLLYLGAENPLNRVAFLRTKFTVTKFRLKDLSFRIKRRRLGDDGSTTTTVS